MIWKLQSSDEPVLNYIQHCYHHIQLERESIQCELCILCVTLYMFQNVSTGMTRSFLFILKLDEKETDTVNR
jgi:hypothetical protein